MSHVADGASNLRGGEEIVEKISEVFSVDLVLEPASMRGLFESVNDEIDMTLVAQGTRALATILKMPDAVDRWGDGLAVVAEQLDKIEKQAQVRQAAENIGMDAKAAGNVANIATQTVDDLAESFDFGRPGRFASRYR